MSFFFSYFSGLSNSPYSEITIVGWSTPSSLLAEMMMPIVNVVIVWAEHPPLPRIKWQLRGFSRWPRTLLSWLRSVHCIMHCVMHFSMHCAAKYCIHCTARTEKCTVELLITHCTAFSWLSTVQPSGQPQTRPALMLTPIWNQECFKSYLALQNLQQNFLRWAGELASLVVHASFGAVRSQKTFALQVAHLVHFQFQSQPLISIFHWSGY